MSLPVAILGGGGHCRVLADAFEAAGVSIVGIIDPADLEWPTARRLVHYHDEDDFLVGHDPESALLAVGVALQPGSDLCVRLRRRLHDIGCTPLGVVHPAASVAADAELGSGVQVMAGAVVQAGAELADDVLVNTRAVVEHDVVVGAGSHIAPGAILLGGVLVSAGVFIGAGATVRQGVSIGPGAVVGMGSVVLGDVPAGTVVRGTWSGCKRSVGADGRD